MADVAVAPLHLPGMITLKGDLGDPRLAMAVRGATGQGVPGRLAATFGPDGRGVLWMAPDEVLLIADGGGKAVASIALAMAGAPHLVADVSDARVAYRVAGPGARAVLARLSPADLAAPGFGPGSVRRTRLAQVPCAAWMTSDTGIDLLVSRSVAGYARAGLEGAVASEVVTSVA